MKLRDRRNLLARKVHPHLLSLCECCDTQVAKPKKPQIISTIRMCDQCVEKGDGGKNMRLYVLDANKVPIPCFNTLAWAVWLGRSRKNKQVALTSIDGYLISTVFLGLDHSFSLNSSAPVLFETMVFPPDYGPGKNGADETYMNRYHTWAEAQADHERIASIIKHDLNESKRATREILANLGVSSE